MPYSRQICSTSRIAQSPWGLRFILWRRSLTWARLLLLVRVRTFAALRDEAVDAGFQHRQRHGAEREDRVVEGAQVELGAERALRLRARFLDRHLAQVIGERLARPGDVAVDLGLDLVIGKRRVLARIGDRLLARPTLGVDAGVDDEPRRAPDLPAEIAEAVVGRVVHPHLVAQIFAIERPAFAEGRDV